MQTCYKLSPLDSTPLHVYNVYPYMLVYLHTRCWGTQLLLNEIQSDSKITLQTFKKHFTDQHSIHSLISWVCDLDIVLYVSSYLLYKFSLLSNCVYGVSKIWRKSGKKWTKNFFPLFPIDIFVRAGFVTWHSLRLCNLCADFVINYKDKI